MQRCQVPFGSLSGSGDPAFGAKVFYDSIVKGTMTDDMARIYVYGRYLMHGGDPDRFGDLTTEDLQIMCIVDLGTQTKNTYDLARLLSHR